MTTTASPLLSLMRNYADYNRWANTTLINWLRTKPAETLDAEVASSFSSIKKTLAHMWQSQQYWLQVLHNTPPEQVERREFHGTLEEVFDTLVSHSEQMADFFRQAEEETVTAPTHIQNKWFECNFPNYEYAVQVFNHSTYHRGQVVTMGRALGFTDAPMTDYNVYKIFGQQ
ncbi:DinB family protein [Chitinophaga lutea]